MASDIPSSLLIRFFEEASSSLSNYESDGCTCSLPLQRKALLQVQLSCLARIVEEHNDDAITVEHVQLALKELSSQINVEDDVKEAMNAMNEAARLAFCRLVLHDECQWDVTHSPPRTLNDGHTAMSKQDLVEYAGLCNGVVRLPNVKEHLRNGTPIFDNIEAKTAPIFPGKRLERIQQLLLRAVGYEIEFGKTEIERYYHGNSDLLDPELVQLLNQLSSNMTIALTNASMDIEANTQALSDQDQGGVTRVVSVSYSEKVVSPDGQELSTTSAPTHESIRQENHNEQQLSQLKMAKQAATLEQSILDDLMSLSQEERNARLNLARQTHQDFVSRAMELPVGPERIAFLTSVDHEKQQLLLIHKLWSTHISDGDGADGKLKSSCKGDRGR